MRELFVILIVVTLQTRNFRLNSMMFLFVIAGGKKMLIRFVRFEVKELSDEIQLVCLGSWVFSQTNRLIHPFFVSICRKSLNHLVKCSDQRGLNYERLLPNTFLFCHLF